MESSRIRELIVLKGRVQGVGLRDHVVQVARSHGVAGTVRNLRSGDAVEIDVEGERPHLEAFLGDVVANLPSFAIVESVRREPAMPRGATGFRIGSTF
jgi:hydrogenase maturation protein HypF